METFSDLPLSEALAKSIQDMGFVKPSPIQAQALPVLLGEPTDFIGLAATGTGKTAAFSIPLLNRIDANKKVLQALILCPTRELCLQVAGQVNLLGKHLGVHALPIYGGSGYSDQIRGLKHGDQVVVGTPGRMIDHLERGTLNLENVTTIVLDEADEMISMGFREDMETILEQAPKESSNVWLFSATMSSSVRKVADQFLNAPKFVQVNRTEMLSSTVEQYYYMTQEKNKPEVLCKLVDAADEFYGVVFCQTKTLVADLTRYLIDRGYKADSLHGDMSQSAREQIMTRFRNRKLKILVGTDVAARGIDVKDMTHVINYSIPRELDSYVHRIGRTARSGKTGFAMSLVTPSHRHLLSKIEKMTKSRISEGVIPSRKAIGVKKVGHILNELIEQKNFPRAIELMNDAWRESLAGMSGEEIAGRFLSMMFPEVFAEERKVEMTREQRPELEREKYREQRMGGQRRDFKRDRPERPRFQRGGYEDRAPRRESRPPFRDDRPERRFDRAGASERPKFARKPKFERDEGFSDRPKFNKESNFAPGSKFIKGPKIRKDDKFDKDRKFAAAKPKVREFVADREGFKPRKERRDGHQPPSRSRH